MTEASVPCGAVQEKLRARQSVVIFRTHLLAPSETFITAQAQALPTFQPYFLGLKRVKGLEIPRESCVISDESGFGELANVVFATSGKSRLATRHVNLWNPALVHAHFGPDGAVVAPFANAHCLPLIVTYHGYDATVYDEVARRSSRLHRLYLRRRSRLQRQAALFIAVSEFIRDCLLTQGFPGDRVTTHYIGVDLATFRPDASVRRNGSVLFVGRLVAKKGCEHLIRAMAWVQSRIPTAELIVVGDGPLRTQLEHLANKLRVRCRFLGQQPPSKIKELLNQAAVFSVPSIRAQSGDAEGFGMVFAEAQAMAVPVASYASGGIPEAVLHDQTGLLAREHDLEGLQQNIFTLLNDSAVWDRMSQAGRRRVEAFFDVRKQASRLEALYSHVIASRVRR